MARRSRNLNNKADKRGFFQSRKFKVLMIIIGVLVVIRIALPYVILHYANKSLANMDGYFGHIEDIDLSIYRGAYTIDSIYLNKTDSVSNKQIPFFSSKIIDLSVEWKSLLAGRIVGELKFEQPRLLFTKDKAEPKDLQKDTTDFKDLFNNFMPLEVNRFEINNGEIHYVDNTSSPKVDVKMDRTYVLAQNLKSVKDTALLPATIRMNANVYDGTLVMHVRLDPLADKPTFDMNVDLKNTSLPKFNQFFKAYGNFDVNKGSFGLFSEVAAKTGRFTGYVKPVIKDLDVLGPEDKDDKFGHKLWEGVIGFAGQIFKNQKKDQIATKVPLEGTFKKAETDIWYSIVVVLRNAFVEALRPSIDNEINIASVDNPPQEEKKGFLKKVFGKDDKKEKDSKRKDRKAKRDK